MSEYRFSEAERFAVFTVDGGKCFWCGIPVYYRDVQIEHVFPERLAKDAVEFATIRTNYGLDGGFQINGFGNWVTCHQGCNLRKSDALLPNSPATLYVLGQLAKRAPRLEAFRDSFANEKRREKVLALLRSALDEKSIDAAEINGLLGDLPMVPIAASGPDRSKIQLSESWELLVSGSPAASMAAAGWKIASVTGTTATLSDGRVAGVVPNVAQPHYTWECSRCGNYGPWDGIICRSCGNREAPD